LNPAAFGFGTNPSSQEPWASARNLAPRCYGPAVRKANHPGFLPALFDCLIGRNNGFSAFWKAFSGFGTSIEQAFSGEFDLHQIQ